MSRVYARIAFASMVERIKKRTTFAYEILHEAGEAFAFHRANRMAAAIAYRAMFAAAPLLLIAVWVVAPILGSEAVVDEILGAVTSAFGPEVAETFEELFVDALEVGGATAIIGFVLLFWTSSSLFLEMQHDLNDIFDVPYEYVSGLVSLVKKRGIGFLWAFGLGLGLLAIWLLNVIWRFLGGLFPEDFEVVHQVLGFLTPLLSFVLLPFVFGLVFQTMTVIRVKWRAIWWGGLFTAFMFLAAAYGIGIYFDLNRVTAASVAGSFVVILLLAYLLSSVFLFGAEVTKVYDAYLVKGEIGASRFVEPSGPPEVYVAEPPDVAAVPKVAVFAFLSGLFVAWRKNRC